MPKEESFPIPLKYIDVIRLTHSDLDVAQEKRIDDCWNVDGDKSVRFVDGFHKIYIIERGNETDTNPPDHIWPDAWTRIGKAALRGEKQEWAIEKPKLEHARKLR